MKSIIRNLAVVLAFAKMTSTQVLAITNPTFNYHENQTLVLELNDWKSKALTLEIIDEDGNKVYVDKISEVFQETKEYNLKDLKIGAYYVVLYGGKQKTISSFKKGIDGINASQNSRIKIFEPEIEIKRRRLFVDYAAYGEDVRLSILSRSGLQLAVFYEGRMEIHEEIDLSKLARGGYVAVLNSGSQRISIPFKN